MPHIINIKNMAAPKLFAVDIDGTFYTKNVESFDKNLSCFAKVKDLGVDILFCTGRSHASAMLLLGPKVEEKTGYNGFPGIYFNGGVVYDKDGHVFFSSKFSPSFLERLCKFLIERNLEQHVLFFALNDFFVLTDQPCLLEARLCEHTLTKPIQIVDVETIVKQEIIKIEILDNSIKSFIQEYQNECHAIYENCCIDLLPPGINKAKGIKHLSEHLGILQGEVGFIGDGANDIEAMEYCDFSFAVGNASPLTKQHAKQVLTITCNEAAFAEAMSRVYNISIN
ncbi:bifunctional HAD-like superfamily/HAD superfamily/HAD-superfamily hydrolase [Babesia duncani]|uniref:Bifunctional HAD-like superfamily/HAD superfamily/HAD-superfamily hydrolase n=1 Tax=Babesia duncani TaxID=323732 RepID=A0AAD9PMQ4_9APIC|nr:bifunctional HAD-like superfamily/HAD superfamily/HAD-superfamily hydrolase [Babesia duncani]